MPSCLQCSFNNFYLVDNRGTSRMYAIPYAEICKPREHGIWRYTDSPRVRNPSTVPGLVPQTVPTKQTRGTRPILILWMWGLVRIILVEYICLLIIADHDVNKNTKQAVFGIILKRGLSATQNCFQI